MAFSAFTVTIRCSTTRTERRRPQASNQETATASESDKRKETSYCKPAHVTQIDPIFLVINATN